MRILITGGAGMIGSHIAEYYASDEKNEIVVLDNLIRSMLFNYPKESVEHNWRFLEQFKNIKLIKGDIRNKEDVLTSLGDGVDVVFHTAAQPGVMFSVNNPEEDYSINAYGTFNVLECVRKVCPQATFIYCSTNKVYGENINMFVITESEKRYQFEMIDGISEFTPIDFTGHTPYGVSKYIGDLYTQEYARIYNIKTAVFRMSCIYGTRQFGFEDQGWVAHFIISAMLDKPITIYGDGKQTRDVLYVNDLIEAYDLFIKSDIKHGVWNIGGGKKFTLSLLEFLDILERKLDKKINVNFSDWRPFDQKIYVSDISKINLELKWAPKTTIEEGIDNLINWVKGNIDLFK